MQPAVNIQSPIRWASPLNRGLLRWWLTLPNQTVGNVWKELTRKSDATPAADAFAVRRRTRPGGWGAWYGDGVLDRLSTPTMDFSAISTLSYSYWMYWFAFANNYDLAFSSSATSVEAGAIYNSPNSGDYAGEYIILVRTDGSNWNGVTMPRPSAAAWHHYTVCMDRNAGAQQVTAVYVDGVSQTLTQRFTNTTATSGFGNHAWHLLARYDGASAGEGFVDDVRIYNRVIRSSEAAELYRASKWGYPSELNWLSKSQMSYPEQAVTTSPYYYARRRRVA